MVSGDGAVARSESDLQRPPTDAPQPPAIPAMVCVKREIGQSRLEAAPRFLKCGSLECALACLRQTLDRSPSANDPALMR